MNLTAVVQALTGNACSPNADNSDTKGDNKHRWQSLPYHSLANLQLSLKGKKGRKIIWPKIISICNHYICKKEKKQAKRTYVV